MSYSNSSAPQNRDPFEHLSGSIEHVTFHSEASGFCVLRVKVTGKHRKYLGSGMAVRTQRSQKRLTNLVARLECGQPDVLE